jgi:hypothetical protein
MDYWIGGVGISSLAARPVLTIKALSFKDLPYYVNDMLMIC